MTTMLLIYSGHNVDEARYSETSASVYETTRRQISQHSITVIYIYIYKRVGHPITCYEGTEGGHRYGSTLSLASALDGEGG